MRSCVWTFVLITFLLTAAGYYMDWSARFWKISAATVAFYVLYTMLLSKRFFTKVEFTDEGIDVIFGKKTLEHYLWASVARVSRGVECRKACYVLYGKDGKILLTLEKRSEIFEILDEQLKKHSL